MIRPVLLLALLAGCTAGPGTDGRCTLQTQAEFLLGHEHGLLTADGLLERHPVTVVLDTGAERSLFTPQALERFSIPSDPAITVTVDGLGGSFQAPTVLPQSWRLGRVAIPDRRLPVAELPSGAQTHAAGLVGADVLRGFAVDLDAARDRMVLFHAPGCRGPEPPWPGPHFEIPMVLGPRGLVLLPVTIGAARLVALLDSGSEYTLLDPAAAGHAGLGAEPGEEVLRQRGVDGLDRFARLRLARGIGVGTAPRSDLRVAVGEGSLPGGIDLLLGLDWLRANRVWIDYPNARFWLQPAGLRPPPGSAASGPA